MKFEKVKFYSFVYRVGRVLRINGTFYKIQFLNIFSFLFSQFYLLEESPPQIFRLLCSAYKLDLGLNYRNTGSTYKLDLGLNYRNTGSTYKLDLGLNYRNTGSTYKLDLGLN